MRTVGRVWSILSAAGVVWALAPAGAGAEPGPAPAWYPEGFPYVPAVDPPADDVGWPSMECATVITLRYEQEARELYRELREAAEDAGWSVRRRRDPEFDFRFDARRGRLKVLAMFEAGEDGGSRLVLYVLELSERP